MLQGVALLALMTAAPPLRVDVWAIDRDRILKAASAALRRVTGRGTGIIDTLHLVEVARAAEVLAGAPAFDAATQGGVRAWFADYVRWMTTDKNGIEERDARNNHATCWVRPPDAMYDREWPMRQASLLFAGLGLSEPSYLELWRRLPADSSVDEVIRNFFIRQPALWVGGAKEPRTAPAPATARASGAVPVASPDKRVEIVVDAGDHGLSWRITLGGRPVVETSALGILVDGVDLARDARIGRVERYSRNERY
ncbi:MAG TPA: alginate lyase family protein, partial [Vicinamibacteria bacterium]